MRGAWSKRWTEVALGLALLAVFGYVLWGVLPGAQGVSWQGHLGGAAGGLLSAWLINDKRSRRRF